MKSSFLRAGAAAIGLALILAACSKSADTSSTNGSPTAATSGGAAATASEGGYIDLPVYPGSTEKKDQGMSMATNTGSVALKIYSSKDDAKVVADWYKAHLPAGWKNGLVSTGDKTIGTFSNELADGDQSIIVATQDDKTTRIQLATKHGK